MFVKPIKKIIIKRTKMIIQKTIWFSNIKQTHQLINSKKIKTDVCLFRDNRSLLRVLFRMTRWLTLPQRFVVRIPKFCLKIKKKIMFEDFRHTWGGEIVLSMICTHKVQNITFQKNQIAQFWAISNDFGIYLCVVKQYRSRSSWRVHLRTSTILNKI